MLGWRLDVPGSRTSASPEGLFNVYALTLQTRPAADQILMLIDERNEADQIAAELHRHGQPVQIVEVERRTDWVRRWRKAH